jgi:riboflavin-specific deaminase-like protein
MAMTADGKIDTIERKGARISGRADSMRVDELRARADAVMVGGRTLLDEDPRLTLRDPRLSTFRTDAGRPPQPAKVGIVSQLGAPGAIGSISDDSRFVNDGGGRVIMFTTTRTAPVAISALGERGVEVIVQDGERIDLAEALGQLVGLGVEHLMVEGGSSLVAALLAAGLVDELQLAIAPMLFGGETAPTPAGGPGWTRDAAIPLTLQDATPNEDGDVVLRYAVGDMSRS